MNLLGKFLQLLFPLHLKCLCCGRDMIVKNDYAICDDCQRNLLVNLEEDVCATCGTVMYSASHYCIYCKNEPRKFDLARAYFTYSPQIAGLVKALKFKRNNYLASFFGECLARAYRHYGLQCDIVTAVPVHKNILKKRGYNHSELMGRAFCSKLNLPSNFGALYKTLDTPLQQGLSHKKRQENLSHAFRTDFSKAFKGKRVLLIDDVMTTGATANECAKVLKHSGAQSVTVLTLANVKTKQN